MLILCSWDHDPEAEACLGRGSWGMPGKGIPRLGLGHACRGPEVEGSRGRGVEVDPLAAKSGGFQGGRIPGERRNGETRHGQAMSGDTVGDTGRCHTILGGFSKRRFFRVAYLSEKMRLRLRKVPAKIRRILALLCDVF